MLAERDTFISHFADRDAPRTKVHNQLHSREDLLWLTILAVLGGADNWKEIEEFGHAKLDELKGILKLPNGIPSHDTLGRGLSLLDPQPLQQGFLNWVQSLASLVGEDVAIDGQTLRRAYEAGGKKGAIPMVSAGAVTNRLGFGQLTTAEKSNEITAMPELLQRLNLTGCTVSIDAMGTPTEIARTIIEGGGDYTLALKGNQPTRPEPVKDWFETAPPNDFKAVTVEKAPQLEGRSN